MRDDRDDEEEEPPDKCEFMPTGSTVYKRISRSECGDGTVVVVVLEVEEELDDDDVGVICIFIYTVFK